MKKRLRFLISGMVALASWLPMAAEGLNYLKITTEADDVVYVALSEKPHVSVGDSGISVSTADDVLTFLFSAKPKLQTSESSAVEEIAAAGEATAFRYAEGVVTVSGLEAGSLVLVSDLQGVVVLQGKSDSQGAWQANVKEMPAGIYILKTKKLTTKFIVK